MMRNNLTVAVLLAVMPAFCQGIPQAIRNGDPALAVAKDTYGLTPLHEAARTGRMDIAELLLANKADVNAADNDGDTPLHQAAELGHKDVVALLLANKADVNRGTVARQQR